MRLLDRPEDALGRLVHRAATEESDQRLLESLPVKPRYGCVRGARTLSDAANLAMRFDAGKTRARYGTRYLRWRCRLESVYGIGPGIAHRPSAYCGTIGESSGGKREIDVKPDVHVMRVFKRTGLTTENERKTVEAAREPTPVSLANWTGLQDIGINWCRPTNPLCGDCPLTAVCPKHIQHEEMFLSEAYLMNAHRLVQGHQTPVSVPCHPRSYRRLGIPRIGPVEIPTPVASPSQGYRPQRTCRAHPQSARTGECCLRHPAVRIHYRYPRPQALPTGAF